MLTDRQAQLVRIIWKFFLERGRYLFHQGTGGIPGRGQRQRRHVPHQRPGEKGRHRAGRLSTHSQRDAYRLAAVTLEPKIANGEAGDMLRGILGKANCKYEAK